jgi:hypothetical protein
MQHGSTPESASTRRRGSRAVTTQRRACTATQVRTVVNGLYIDLSPSYAIALSHDKRSYSKALTSVANSDLNTTERRPVIAPGSSSVIAFRPAAARSLHISSVWLTGYPYIRTHTHTHTHTDRHTHGNMREETYTCTDTHIHIERHGYTEINTPIDTHG